MRFSAGTFLAACSLVGGLATVGSAPTAWAANATILDTDPNADGLGFGLTDAFAFGIYGIDPNASLDGNDFLVQSQNGIGGGGDGAGISVPVSNGENGIDVTFDGATNGGCEQRRPQRDAAQSRVRSDRQRPVNDPAAWLGREIAERQRAAILDVGPRGSQQPHHDGPRRSSQS
jgi:hypothetical protein